MSDGMLVVSFAALQQAGADIQHAVSTMQGNLDDLERAAQPLVANWNGDAKEAYLQRQTRWRGAAADLTRILADIRRAVDESALQYAQTEQSNARMFS